MRSGDLIQEVQEVIVISGAQGVAKGLWGQEIWYRWSRKSSGFQELEGQLGGHRVRKPSTGGSGGHRVS